MMKVMAIVIIIRPNFSHNIQLKNNNWLEIKNVLSWNKKCENKVRVCMYWKEVKMMKARDTGCIAGVPSASPKNLVTRIR